MKAVKLRLLLRRLRDEGLRAVTKDVGALSGFLVDGYLLTGGWLESKRRGVPVDGHGNAVPWYSYPAIWFLAPRIRAGWRVLEFGSGMSTLWWASHDCEVVALEGKEEWARIVRERLKGTGEVIVASEANPAAYLEAASALKPGWHVIVVDGPFRNECIGAVIELIDPSGVLILDNSDREEYRAGMDLLRERGWRRIDFVGLAGGSRKTTATSVFYRQGNVLEI